MRAKQACDVCGMEYEWRDLNEINAQYRIVGVRLACPECLKRFEIAIAIKEAELAVERKRAFISTMESEIRTIQNQSIEAQKRGNGRKSDTAPVTVGPQYRHELRTWRPYFQDVLRGVKLFELRRDDRMPSYQVGDLLALREYDREKGNYTGRVALRVVTYILRPGEIAGIEPGYCTMGIAIPERSDHDQGG